jgi:hypothetical protein
VTYAGPKTARLRSGAGSGPFQLGRDALGEGDEGIGLPLGGGTYVRAAVSQIVIQQLFLDPQESSMERLAQLALELRGEPHSPVPGVPGLDLPEGCLEEIERFTGDGLLFHDGTVFGATDTECRGSGLSRRKECRRSHLASSGELIGRAV